jgi:hypothetical protein
MYAKRGRDCAISVDVRLGGSRGAGLVSMDSLHNQDLQSEVHECLGSGRTKLVDLYLSGHDHDLQHLEFKGHPTSFVISGGGGAELVGWTTPPQAQGPWGLRALGLSEPADFKQRSSGHVYRQRCDGPLLVQETGGHHGTLLIAQPSGLLLLGDQDAYTGPVIMS